MRKGIYLLDISPDVVFLGRESFRQIVDEMILAFRQTIDGAVLQHFDHIIAIFVHGTERESVHDAEIGEQLAQLTRFVKATENMHARWETHTFPFKVLQAATDDGVFLQHRHLVAFLGQQGTRNQTAQAAANNYDILSIGFQHLLSHLLFTQQMLAHRHRAHQHAQHAMRIDVLPHKKQVGDFGLE